MTSLEILGCNATAPGPTGAASSYLLDGAPDADGRPGGKVLVDAGPGSLSAFTRSHALSELAAIVVTHLHADHCLDLMAWAYRWTFPDVLPRIPLFVPSEELERIGAFDALFGIPTLPTMRTPVQSAFDVHGMDLDSGDAVEVGGWSMTPWRVKHSVPSAALRFTRSGRVVAFSSDTGPCPELTSAARDADLFVCESTYIEADESVIHGHGHLTATLAAEEAVAAGAGHLVLTHFARPEQAEEMGRLAREVFDGPVSVAREGLTLRL